MSSGATPFRATRRPRSIGAISTRDPGASRSTNARSGSVSVLPRSSTKYEGARSGSRPASSRCKLASTRATATSRVSPSPRDNSIAPERPPGAAIEDSATASSGRRARGRRRTSIGTRRPIDQNTPSRIASPTQKPIATRRASVDKMIVASNSAATTAKLAITWAAGRPPSLATSSRNRTDGGTRSARPSGQSANSKATSRP